LAPPTNFDTTRIRFGDMVAGIGGAVLILSLFLDWYSLKGKGLAASAGSEGLSGWEALGFIDILLFLIGLIAIAVAVLRAANSMPRQLPASPGLIVLALGALAVLLVLFRIVSSGDFGHPEVSNFIDSSPAFGIFISLLSAIAVAVGGWLTWNEEGKPKPGGATGRGVGAGPGAGAPLGGGPAAGAPVGGQPQQAAAPAAAAPAQAAAPAAAAGAAKADWYPDPRGEKRLRYWDGSQWTDHTAD
jgi:hypothetical protein